MVDFASIGKVIGGLGGLFGKKGHDAGGNASLSVRGQAHGARMGAEEHGFNPLTLLQFGQVGAMSDRSGAPPLASVQLLTEGLQGIYEEKTGVAAQRREREKLELDRAKIELERLKAGSTYAVVSPLRATDQMSGPRMGNTASEVRQSSVTQRGTNGQADTVLRGFGGLNGASLSGGRPLPLSYPTDSRRDADHKDQESHSGFLVTDNEHVPFPVYTPTLDGDEPLQWYDWPSAVIYTGGSFLYDRLSKAKTRKERGKTYRVSPSPSIPRETPSAVSGQRLKPVAQNPARIRGRQHNPRWPGTPIFSLN